MSQLRFLRVSSEERRREGLCALCQGHRLLCGRSPCLRLTEALALAGIEKALRQRNLQGSSPPAAFVGSWGYPKVLAGPLVPPLPRTDTTVMDAPELWLGRTMEEVLRYRFTLIRGKSPTAVDAARNPPRLLATLQEAAMASKPAETEVWFTKEPRPGLFFSPRAAPLGPSAPLERLSLAENPSVVKEVEYVVSDRDLRAASAAVRLFSAGIPVGQVTRLLSVGLLGVQRHRKLVPTEWSITAVDDILGRALHRPVLDYPQVNEFMVFGAQAFNNNVQVLLFPSHWMFEALEAWLTSSNPRVDGDYELTWGRSTYAYGIAGAYYAARLPVLEYLDRARRQAAAITFLEVGSGWIPIGVWRFRELCREALRQAPLRFETLEEGLKALGSRLRLPLAKWVQASRLLDLHRRQRHLEPYLLKQTSA